MDSNSENQKPKLQSVVVSTDPGCNSRVEASSDTSNLSDIEISSVSSQIGEDSNLSGGLNLNPDQCQALDNAADQLDKLAFKHRRGKKIKLTLEERREACRARLEAKGVKWDPELYGKRVPGQAESPRPAKRSEPDNNTPPSADTQRKRQRRAESSRETFSQGPGGSFRAALTTKKVAMVPVSFPEDKLSPEQGTELEGLIANSLISYTPPDGGVFPIFEGTYMESGALIVSCSNEYSRDWVIELASSLTLQGGLTLKAGDKKEILRATKVLVRIPPNLMAKMRRLSVTC